MNVITVTPTISTTAYSAGDAIGGKLEFNGTAHAFGFIQSVMIIDNDGEKAPIDLVLFKDDFTVTADNSAFSVTAGEESDIIAVIPVRTYHDLGAGLAVGIASNLGLPFQNVADYSTLYGQLVIRAAHTYTATNDLMVTLGVLDNGEM